ncbi:hypothetical protein BHE74_00056166 [Ensete ventricosum]|nr:hypothetical protein BHE74_00056166 [Ensete ventricosum]
MRKKEKKKRKKRKKYQAAVLACALPARPCRPGVDREPLSPSSPAGRSRDVAALAARGRLSSPHGETKRVLALGERTRRTVCTVHTAMVSVPFRYRKNVGTSVLIGMGFVPVPTICRYTGTNRANIRLREPDYLEDKVE